MSGVPDRIILLPKGRVIFAEVKAPGKKPRKLQLSVHKLFKKLGFKVLVIDSKEQVDSLIREVVRIGVHTTQIPADS